MDNKASLAFGRTFHYAKICPTTTVAGEDVLFFACYAVVRKLSYREYTNSNFMACRKRELEIYCYKNIIHRSANRLAWKIAYIKWQKWFYAVLFFWIMYYGTLRIIMKSLISAVNKQDWKMCIHVLYLLKWAHWFKMYYTSKKID